MLTRQRIAVFGGSGFIGRHLVKRLATKGYIVRVAVRNLRHAGVLRLMGEPGQIVIKQVDITNPQEIESVISGSDAVINLLGSIYESRQYTFEYLHIEIPRRLGKLCKMNQGIRKLIHVSTLGADETSDARYLRSKAIGERVIRDNFPETAIFRPGVIFGYGSNFFDRLITMIRIGPILAFPVQDFLAERKSPIFQPVYVGDVADALVLAVNGRNLCGKSYELGGPKTYSMCNIVDMIRQRIGHRCLAVPIPFSLVRVIARIAQYLPRSPITYDQVITLQEGKLVTTGLMPGFSELNIKPTAMDSVMAEYLKYHFYENSRRENAEE